MSPPEPSYPTIARSAHLKYKKKDLKINFIKMIKVLKKEMNKSLKEIYEKAKKL